MEAKLFKRIVARVIEPKLSTLGYEMDFNPPGYDFEGDIYFEKWLQEGIHIVINFQPNFRELNKITRFTVILARNHPSYEFYKKRQYLPEYFLGDPLASWLWIKDRHHLEWESEHWWHFRSEEELEAVCLDVLDKLLQYGIPYLEDLNSKSLRLQG